MSSGKCLSIYIVECVYWFVLIAITNQPPYLPRSNLMAYNNYLVSNEVGHQNVIPYFQQHINPRNIYIGVGPDQNYTYISIARPSFAFIVDNREENQERLIWTEKKDQGNQEENWSNPQSNPF